MYEHFVIVPTSGEEAATHLKEMEPAGFHGCIGSTDATHVGMERYRYRLAQIHQGVKLPMPSRTYNLPAMIDCHIVSTGRHWKFSTPVNLRKAVATSLHANVCRVG